MYVTHEYTVDKMQYIKCWIRGYM